jgi:hypothetical protein
MTSQNAGSKLKSIFRAFDFRFERASFLKPSVISLIAANIFPVIGVIFLGWNVFLLLFLFWMENVVVGFYTVLKMLFSSTANFTGVAAKVTAIPFFCVHYGIFTAVHGMFVFVVFGSGMIDDSSLPEGLTVWQTVMSSQVAIGGLILLISHGFSFFYNYIGGGEYKNSKIGELMAQPYGRVVILHLTIIFGGFLMMLLGSPVAGLLFLIVLKTAIDLRSHLREHGKNVGAALKEEAREAGVS